jgi:hypothetical protein
MRMWLGRKWLVRITLNLKKTKTLSTAIVNNNMEMHSTESQTVSESDQRSSTTVSGSDAAGQMSPNSSSVRAMIERVQSRAAQPDMQKLLKEYGELGMLEELSDLLPEEFEQYPTLFKRAALGGNLEEIESMLQLIELMQQGKIPQRDYYTDPKTANHNSNSEGPRVYFAQASAHFQYEQDVRERLLFKHSATLSKDKDTE